MKYWIEKTDKYITIWKEGKTTNEIICYQEAGYAELVEKEFEIMVKALNDIS